MDLSHRLNLNEITSRVLTLTLNAAACVFQHSHHYVIHKLVSCLFYATLAICLPYK